MAIKFIEDALVPPKKAKKEVIQTLIKLMGRYYPERSHETVHASDVTKSGFCARKYRLMDVLNLKQPDTYIGPGLRATFDVGKMTAKLLTDQWSGDQALGHWKCNTCGTKKLWQKKPSDGCAGMGRCAWEYEEVNFVHEQTGLSGSIDLFMSLGQPKATAIEIKIMKVEDFDKLVAPLGEHKARTRLYLRLIAESVNPLRAWVDQAHAVVLYISRGFGKKNMDAQAHIVPFKEYDVYRDDESVQPYIDRAALVHNARRDNFIPERTVCDSINCPTAKSCPVRHQCWSGAH